MGDTSKKLVLGTVQLGLEYGVGNTSGKPSREEAIYILEEAYQNGIRTFDTASLYGDAEEILGEFVAKNRLGDEITIISKLRPIETAHEVENEVRSSLKRLKRNEIDGYLLHRAEDLYIEGMLGELLKCKTKGLVKNVGVSVYDEKDALVAVSSEKIDYIQIPYNVFDQRLNKTGFFETAKKNGVKIFARSAFLQGLLLMKINEVPVHLKDIIPYLKEFDAVIRPYGITRREAAFLFPYINPEIDYVVFGVDTVEQLKENISIVQDEKIERFSLCFNELKNRFLEIDKTLIRPDLWETRK